MDSGKEIIIKIVIPPANIILTPKKNPMINFLLILNGIIQFSNLKYKKYKQVGKNKKKIIFLLACGLQ